MCHSSPFYGKWAYNMAYSIRAYSNIPIHLIYDDKSISNIELSIFSSFEKYDFGKDYCYEKIDLFDKSPFDETLYLDVDGVVIKNPEDIFERLEGVDIWIQPMGKGRRGDSITYNWVDNESIWDKYNLTEWFTTCQTSIIYFTKNSKTFFEKLKENYKNKLDKHQYKDLWGKSKQHPDEVYYSITLSQLGIELQDFRPVFFPEIIKEDKEILNEYYILSMYGGNNVKPYAKDLYDRIMMKVMNDKGKEHYFKAFNLYKNKFINR